MDAGAQQPQGQWTTGLFGCFEDLGNCFMTYCCPCATFAQNAEVIDKGNPPCAYGGKALYFLAYIGGGCFYTYTYRGKLRGLFNLPEDPYNDFFVHCLCSSCAICQEYRELKNRGIDPSLGWSENEQRMNKATQVPPNVAPGMAR